MTQLPSLQNEKQYELQLQKEQYYRLMIEKEQVYMDHLRSQIASSPDEKKSLELAKSERNLQKLQAMLVRNQPEVIASLMSMRNVGISKGKLAAVRMKRKYLNPQDSTSKNSLAIGTCKL